MTPIRRPGVASATVLVTLCASFAIANAAAPEWAHRIGLDVWNLSQEERSRDDAAEDASRIDSRAETSAKRRELANQYARNAVQNEVPLAELTDNLMRLFANEPGFHTCLEANYRDVRSARLRFALHAIARCERFLEHDSAKREQLSTRYRNEYAQMVATSECEDG